MSSASHLAEQAASCRNADPAFAGWARGYGAIEHTNATQVRVYELAEGLVNAGRAQSPGWVFEKLSAAVGRLRPTLS